MIDRILRSAMEGYKEGRGKTSLPDIPDNFSHDDIKDYLPDEDEHTPSTVIRSQAEPVRVIGGLFDFLQEVVEQTQDWIENEFGEGHAPKTRAPKPPAIRTISVVAKDWKCSRFSATSAQSKAVLLRRNERTLVRLVNYGPEIVYASHTSFSPNNIPQPNNITIPVSDPATGKYFPVELPTRDEIWVAAGTTGGVGASWLEVSEFFGYGDQS